MFALTARAEEIPIKPHPEKAPTAEEITTSIDRGLAFLLANQNKNGSWGSARNTKALNIYAPVPGAHHAFQFATSALCVAALHDTSAADKSSELREALRRGEDFLIENLPRLRRATGTAIYNTWGHAYGLQALARMHTAAEGDSARQEKITEIIHQQIDLLKRYESVDGGWAYYDFRAQTKKPASSSIGFVTATVLVAFKDVEKIGIELPEKEVKRGIASINRQRKNDHSYAYGEYLKMRPMYSINRPGGSLGRSQACNAALRMFGDETVTDQVITDWLDRLWSRNGWLSIGRKRPVPHESWFAVAGYFYYFGHYYASYAIEILPTPDQQKYREQLAAILLPLQEKDGDWWDYPLYAYHRPYGTAFALMSLQRCLPK